MIDEIKTKIRTDESFNKFKKTARSTTKRIFLGFINNIFAITISIFSIIIIFSIIGFKNNIFIFSFSFILSSIFSFLFGFLTRSKIYVPIFKVFTVLFFIAAIALSIMGFFTIILFLLAILAILIAPYAGFTVFHISIFTLNRGLVILGYILSIFLVFFIILFAVFSFIFTYILSGLLFIVLVYLLFLLISTKFITNLGVFTRFKLGSYNLSKIDPNEYNILTKKETKDAFGNLIKTFFKALNITGSLIFTAIVMVIFLYITGYFKNFGDFLLFNKMDILIDLFKYRFVKLYLVILIPTSVFSLIFGFLTKKKLSIFVNTLLTLSFFCIIFFLNVPAIISKWSFKLKDFFEIIQGNNRLFLYMIRSFYLFSISITLAIATNIGVFIKKRIENI